MIRSPPVRDSFFDRFEGSSPLFWAVLVLLLALNFWFDYYHPPGFTIDVVIVMVLAIAYKPPREPD
jgi:hypothetical protein